MEWRWTEDELFEDASKLIEVVITLKWVQRKYKVKIKYVHLSNALVEEN
jgi:hypothetical protein